MSAVKKNKQERWMLFLDGSGRWRVVVLNKIVKEAKVCGEGVSHVTVRGSVLGRGCISTKAVGETPLCIYKEQQGDQCDWWGMREGKSSSKTSARQQEGLY